MNCENARMFLGMYDESELGAAPAREIQEHLKECPACAKELAHREKLLRHLPPMPKFSESYWESYTESVLRRLKKPEPLLGLRHWRWATALACSLLLAGGAIFYKAQERRQMRELITHLELLENLNLLEQENFEKWVSQ